MILRPAPAMEPRRGPAANTAPPRRPRGDGIMPGAEAGVMRQINSVPFRIAYPWKCADAGDGTPRPAGNRRTATCRASGGATLPCSGNARSHRGVSRSPIWRGGRTSARRRPSGTSPMAGSAAPGRCGHGRLPRPGRQPACRPAEAPCSNRVRRCRSDRPSPPARRPPCAAPRRRRGPSPPRPARPPATAGRNHRDGRCGTPGRSAGRARCRGSC